MTAESRPLDHTPSGRQRIVVGLGWDARAGKTSFIDRLRGTADQHDLDLCCYLFDANRTCTGFVGPMAQDSMDASGSLYHSGDDATGEGGGDDESISCELTGLPASARYLVFLAEIRSNQTFSDIDGASWRLADGHSNRILYKEDIDRREGATACVLAIVERDRLSETGWSFTPLMEFPDWGAGTDWPSYLSRYL